MDAQIQEHFAKLLAIRHLQEHEAYLERSFFWLQAFLELRGRELNWLELIIFHQHVALVFADFEHVGR